MSDIDDDLSKSEPNPDECRTERVVNNISICLIGNDKCRYALAATYAKAIACTRITVVSEYERGRF